jgi:hypothetical protein
VGARSLGILKGSALTGAQELRSERRNARDATDHRSARETHRLAENGTLPCSHVTALFLRSSHPGTGGKTCRLRNKKASLLLLVSLSLLEPLETEPS